MASKSETATLCPFCGTSHVLEEKELQGIRPTAVIPFKFGKDRLLELFSSWAKRKIFAPVGFKKLAKTDSANGVYMPFFTFDSNTNSVYHGRLGFTKTRVVHTSKGTKTETYTVWRNVSGTYSHFFNDVLVNAGNHLENGKIDRLAPFDNASACKYESRFLSGFVAHHYEKSIDECWSSAREDMAGSIRSNIVSLYGADKVGYLNVSTNHEDVTYKYMLLPVYVLNYAFKGKQYTVYANGSTGKIIGKSPVAWWKVLIAVLIGIAAVVGVAYLLSLAAG